jgi:hypothetical protein
VLDLDIEMETMTQVLVDEDLEVILTHLMDILFDLTNWDLNCLGKLK